MALTFEGSMCYADVWARRSARTSTDREAQKTDSIDSLESGLKAGAAAATRRQLKHLIGDAGLALLVPRLLDLARADIMEAGTSGCCDALAAARQIADAPQGGGFLVSVGTEVPVALVAIEAAKLRAVLTTLLEDSRQAGAMLAAITIHIAERTEISVSDDGRGHRRRRSGPHL